MTDDLKAIVSLSTSYASSQYMDAFFDVSAADSIASGLAPFSASAGFKDVGITGVIRYAFTDNWSASFIGNYTRLVDDAADSSIAGRRVRPTNFSPDSQSTTRRSESKFRRTFYSLHRRPLRLVGHKLPDHPSARTVTLQYQAGA